jgi:uncharacterized protein
MEYTELAKTYQNFYVPTFKINVNGEDVQGKGIEIVSVSIDNTLEGADQFSFTVNNVFDITNRQLRWIDDVFSFGKKVEIWLGYVDKKTLKLMIVGIITSVKTSFPSGGLPQLEISGYDLSYCMMKVKKSRSKSDIKYSEIVELIASEYQLKPNTEDTKIKYPKVEKKEEESDFDFVTRLGKELNFEFFVREQNLYFRSPANDKNAVVTLEWGKSLVSFSPEINISQQVSEVEVKGWDIKAKKEIIGRAKRGDEEGKDNKGKSGSELLPFICKEQTVERIQLPVYSQAEADARAKAILNQRAENLLTGNGESIGIPEIQAGENIALKGLGNKFSKTYYIQKATHSISASGYKTTFNVKENSIPGK